MIDDRYKELGSHQTSSINGIRWKALLDSTDVILLTGDNVPTHV